MDLARSYSIVIAMNFSPSLFQYNWPKFRPTCMNECYLFVFKARNQIINNHLDISSIFSDFDSVHSPLIKIIYQEKILNSIGLLCKDRKRAN